MAIVIVNGPNLNLLDLRESRLYGGKSMDDVLADLREHFDVDIDYFQSNHEGALIDFLQKIHLESLNGKVFEGIVLNAGGYAHTSVALRDCVEMLAVPVVEVHITDIYSREAFRRVSLLSDVCKHSIVGKGIDGYKQGIEWLLKR